MVFSIIFFFCFFIYAIFSVINERVDKFSANYDSIRREQYEKQLIEKYGDAKLEKKYRDAISAIVNSELNLDYKQAALYRLGKLELTLDIPEKDMIYCDEIKEAYEHAKMPINSHGISSEFGHGDYPIWYCMSKYGKVPTKSCFYQCNIHISRKDLILELMERYREHGIYLRFYVKASYDPINKVKYPVPYIGMYNDTVPSTWVHEIIG